MQYQNFPAFLHKNIETLADPFQGQKLGYGPCHGNNFCESAELKVLLPSIAGRRSHVLTGQLTTHN